MQSRRTMEKGAGKYKKKRFLAAACTLNYKFKAFSQMYHYIMSWTYCRKGLGST